MNPSPWSRRAGAGPMGPGRRTGSGIIAAVVLLVVYAVVRSGRISSEEVIFFVVLIPSIIIHEVSHGWVALACGDDTAKRAGRLTLNPLRHVDPLGTVILPIILVLTVHSAFGYAKPVPVNVSRLRHPRNQSLLVGLAGPAVNLLLAALAALVLRLIAPAGTIPPPALVSEGFIPVNLFWQAVFLFGFANIILAAFNLIPLPPLDGSAVLERLLPRRLWPGYLRLRMFALPILIVVVLWIPSISNHATVWGMRAWSHLLG